MYKCFEIINQLVLSMYKTNPFFKQTAHPYAAFQKLRFDANLCLV